MARKKQRKGRMDHLQWNSHHFSGLSWPGSEAFVAEIKRTKEDLLDIGKREGKCSLLSPVDINDTVFNPDAMTTFKNVTSILEPYTVVTAVSEDRA